MNKLPEQLPDFDLEEIKKLVADDDNSFGGEAISAEDILIDEAVGAFSGRKVPEPPPDILLKELVPNFSASTPPAEDVKPEPLQDDAGPEIYEFDFSAEFSKHLTPSEGHEPDASDHFKEAPPREPGATLAERVREFRKEAPFQRYSVEESRIRARACASSLRLRTLFAFVLTTPQILITCAQGLGILPSFLQYTAAGNPYLVLFFVALFQFLTILLSFDIIARGLSDLIRLRPGAETLLVLANISTLLHIALVSARPWMLEDMAISQTVGFLPYSALASLSLCFALLGVAKRYSAYARTYKTASAASEESADCVISEDDTLHGVAYFSRRPANIDDFTERTESPDISTKLMKFFTPFLIILSIVLSVVASSGHEGHFFWIFSAFCCVSVPFTTFTSYPLVYSKITRRLSHMGAALAGWSAASETPKRDAIIIEDGDLFPPGTLSLNGLKILGDHSFDSIKSLTASILHASGSGLYKALDAVSGGGTLQISPVSELEMFEGGVLGCINGDRIMLGTLNFMHSMGIQIPKELSSKSSVFTSINHDLACVLAVSYAPASNVKGALLLLEQQRMINIPAVRDINITPTQLRDKFGVDPDSLEWPTVEERAKLSDPAREVRGKVFAILAKDGLCPYAESIIGGQKLRRFSKINLGIHFATLILGFLIAFYFTSQTNPVNAEIISPLNLIIFMSTLWAMQWIISWFSNRY